MLIDTLLFEDGPGEMRTAAVADGRVFEVGHHRESAPSLVGAVYRGRVGRIMSSLNIAFIDIGTARDGFLRAGGIRWPKDGPRRLNRVLQEGAAVTVQVTRDPVADKGPVVTCLAQLPGRFLEYCPGVPGVRCGPGIATAAQMAVRELLDDEEGVTLRLAPPLGELAALRDDLDTLRGAWRSVAVDADRVVAPKLLAPAPSPVAHTLAVHIQAPLKRVRTNSLGLDRAVRGWCDRYRPELAACVEPPSESVFDGFDVDSEIEGALSARLVLPDGMELLFDEGEVLTAIDVNSGARDPTPGRAAMEINLSALPEIARQLRLRQIGGAVVIDLLKMRDPQERVHLVDTFRALVKTDPGGCHVLGISALGLLEVTRRRTGPSLAEEQRAAPAVPDLRADAVAYRALRALRREAKAQPGQRLALDVAPPVATLLETDLRNALATAAAGFADVCAQAGWPADRFAVRRT